MSEVFTATSSLHTPLSWEWQIRRLERKGAARFRVVAQFFCSGKHAGKFSGEFDALAGEKWELGQGQMATEALWQSPEITPGGKRVGGLAGRDYDQKKAAP